MFNSSKSVSDPNIRKPWTLKPYTKPRKRNPKTPNFAETKALPKTPNKPRVRLTWRSRSSGLMWKRSKKEFTSLGLWAVAHFLASLLDFLGVFAGIGRIRIGVQSLPGCAVLPRDHAGVLGSIRVQRRREIVTLFYTGSTVTRRKELMPWAFGDFGFEVQVLGLGYRVSNLGRNT